ncbi:phosphotriesterase [Kitasatospora phosalacinea]|uniref:phosphotriesterase family protein n=1 Tax=Kitasatospora phosalacinea TaxID=2065 RepID=UPI003651C3DD
MGHSTTPTVNTVLGPVPAAELGVVAIHEALLSVLPGAEHAWDVTIDRAEVFETLAAKLTEFRTHGGGTVVDRTGMFHGRDLPLYEALSRTTGVHLVASTGQGPEELLGGYFLTPQTDPPTPWPAEKFAELFALEAAEGMVVPRVERRGPAGLIATTATRTGMTATDESLFRGAARAALATGVPVSVRYGADALHDLDVLLDEHLPADRIAVAGLDRTGADLEAAALQVARRGAYAVLDHIGTEGIADGGIVGGGGAGGGDRRPTDAERADQVAEAFAAGLGHRLLLSVGATGVAKGHPGNDLPYAHLLTGFVPLLRERGLDEAQVRRLLVDNPRELLTVRAA